MVVYVKLDDGFYQSIQCPSHVLWAMARALSYRDLPHHCAHCSTHASKTLHQR